MMDLEHHYDRHLANLAERSRRLYGKQSAHFQNLLVLCTGILAVLVSLHDSSLQPPHIRAVFFLVTALFGMSSLGICIILYGHLSVAQRAFREYLNELNNARREGRTVETVYTPFPRWLTNLQAAAYILVLLSLISLLAYSFVKGFIQC